MFAAPCDAGQSGAGCATGAASLLRWSYGTTIATTVFSSATGRANTSSLYALNGNADGPYEAATYCKQLVMQNGHSDWYLPAVAELSVLYTNRVAIGGFDLSGVFYWSSTESSTLGASDISFLNGTQPVDLKTGTFKVRCVRR